MFTQKTLIFALTLLIVGLANVTNSIAQNNLDPTFGNGGIVIAGQGNTLNVATTMAIQWDGKIIVVGDGTLSGPNWDFAVARLLLA